MSRGPVAAACLLLMMGAFGSLQADVILMRDGRRIFGTIISQSRDSIRINVDGKVRVVPKTAVQRVQYGAAATAAERRRMEEEERRKQPKKEEPKKAEVKKEESKKEAAKKAERAKGEPGREKSGKAAKQENERARKRFARRQEPPKDQLFVQGRLFADVARSYGTTPGPPSSFADPSAGTLASLIALSSTEQQTRELALLGFTLSGQPPSVSSAHQRLGFEYALTDTVGLGGSVNTTTFSIQGANLAQILGNDFVTLFALSAVFGGGTGTLRNLALLPLIPVNATSRPLRTAEFEFSFHIANGPFDTFVRVSMGGGSVDGLDIGRGGLTLGTRWNFSGRTYATAEAYYASFSGFEEGNLAGSSIHDAGLRLGIGVMLARP